MEMRPILALLLLPPPPRPPMHLTDRTCGEGDAGWGGEVGAPKAMQGRRVVGVEHKALQGVLHGAARG